MPVDGAAIHRQVVRAARDRGVGEVEAILASANQALTRFANNAIHQNVAEISSHLSVRARIEGRTARASTNRLDPDSIRGVVEQALSLIHIWHRWRSWSAPWGCRKRSAPAWIRTP